MQVYKDATKSESQRVADLLGRMTPEEKLAQMRIVSPADRLLRDGRYCEEQARELVGQGIGGCYTTSSLPADALNGIQDFLMNRTRLGIPMIVMSESIHGVMSAGATVFPQAIGLGATFNTELMNEIAGIMGREARALGITQVYAPDLDLSREPRWGRVEENYGEDPCLTSELGVAYVRALQAQGVAATLKHYVAHGSPEGGLNLAPVHAGERELRDTMLPPFAEAIQKGGAMSIMPAYSELDGVPIHASRMLLTDVLRQELGFDGFVISDFGAVSMLHTFHRTADSRLAAGIQALGAGVDMEAPSVFGFGEELAAAVAAGDVPMEWIDRAVERILRIKFRLGLFENPWAPEGGRDLIHHAGAVDAARRAARESVVLLENRDGLLPLSDTVGSVALIGPAARTPQLGDYTTPASAGNAVSLLTALTRRLGEGRVCYALGCTAASGADRELAEAVEAARKADVAILTLGDNSSFYGGVGWGDAEGQGVVTCGEGFDMSDLALPGRQQELLQAVAATGTPVVLVLMTGRPYCIGWAKEHIPAILQAWYPGEQGGPALCDLLFGDASPSARLPVSFPQSTGHIPAFYNHKVSARGYYKKPGSPGKPGRDYVFADPAPLYPFGCGLSYTTFAYGGLSVTPERTGVGGAVEVSVTVTNTGDRPGSEVVQLYLTDCYSRITSFVRRLRRFAKIALEPGRSRQVRFTLGPGDFSFINEDMKPEIEPGEFTVSVGDQQASFWVDSAG